MTRSRIRNIVVDDIPYRWTVGQIDAGRVKARVWHEASQRGGTLEVLVAFDDPWVITLPNP